MKEQMLDLLSKNATTLSTTDILINFSVALAIGMLIFISYRTAHTRVVYSARFNVTLLMLTMVTTLVMSVIGNNVALSLGMVGALSIVRFRTAVKDPRDTAYIFWCIAVGICCGVSSYEVAAIGSVFIFVLMVVFGMVQDNHRYLLVIRGKRSNEKEIISTVNEFYNNKAILKVNNTTDDNTEFIYELTQKILNKAKNKGDISEKLYNECKADTVNIVCQSDSIG